MAYAITLQSSDSGIAPGDRLGILAYAASNDTSGSDAITIAATIHAEAESEFTANSNKTSLVFSTSSSGLNDLTSHIRITSSGHTLPFTDMQQDLGASGLRFRNVYGDKGIFNIVTFNSNKGFINIDNDTITDLAISGGYSIGSLDIFLNGVKLINGDDFTATDGSGIILASAPGSGSVIEYLSFYPSQPYAGVSTGGGGINISGFNTELLAGDYIQLVYDSGTGVDPTGTLTINVTGLTPDIHLTGVAFNTSTRDLTFSWNRQLSNLSVNIPSSGSTSHPAIDAASSSDNSGRTYIQDILLDEYGHVTGLATATETGTISNGSDIYLDNVSFNNTTRNLTFSWNSGISDLSVNIPVSGEANAGVLTGSGLYDKLVASTGIQIIYNTGTDVVVVGTQINQTSFSYFLH